ncbi:MAG: septum formation initiator family protein [Pseudomonadales bacterium]|nr:septum formation initiator family protein [Pseudomonadales bacterium]
MIRVLAIVSALLLVFLQYRLWFGDAGFFAIQQLRIEVMEKLSENNLLDERNRLLALEVAAYQDKDDFSIIEDRARSELGMIMRDETFFLIVGQPD